MRVSDVMKKQLEIVDTKESLAQAEQKMREAEVNVVLVHHNKSLVGVLSDQALMLRAKSNGGSPEKSKMQDIMRSRLVVCYEDESIEDSSLLMALKKAGYLLVLNREDDITGILSREDIAQKADIFFEDVLKKITSDDKKTDGGR
ncbi:CBS domain-containing protein [candidate division FCPU426 bacterium]|nr:CBS domain-containing protein [candidate division FCPU426 bacterium]